MYSPKQQTLTTLCSFQFYYSLYFNKYSVHDELRKLQRVKNQRLINALFAIIELGINFKTPLFRTRIGRGRS